MREVVICEPVRSPIGRYGGVFKSMNTADLAVTVLKGLLERAGIHASQSMTSSWDTNVQSRPLAEARTQLQTEGSVRCDCLR